MFLIRVYLDDERICPLGWNCVKSAEDAIKLLKREIVSEISLDHDLGTEQTGYDVLLWIENHQSNGGRIPDKIHVHTANSSARIKMELGVKAINSRR
jgi:hypothetical protein